MGAGEKLGFFFVVVVVCFFKAKLNALENKNVDIFNKRISDT